LRSRPPDLDTVAASRFERVVICTVESADVWQGGAIEIAYLQFTRISDGSVAITDRGGETQFLNLDTGAYR
jgi:hypothetical protein